MEITGKRPQRSAGRPVATPPDELMELLRRLDDLDPSTAGYARARVAGVRESFQAPLVFDALVQQASVAADYAAETRVTAVDADRTLVVRVYHNIAQHSFDGYHDGDPLVEVFTDRVVPVEAAAQGEANMVTLEWVYTLLNVGDDPEFGTADGRACLYRLRGNRSLSVGDVAQVGDVFYACGRVGWYPISEPELVVSVTTHGATPVNE